MEIVAPEAALAKAGERVGADAAAGWNEAARGDGGEETPVVDSPSIAGGWQASAEGDGWSQATEADWPSVARHDAPSVETEAETAGPQRLSRLRNLLRSPAFLRASGKPFVSLPVTCAAMGALVLALIVWRLDVVRLLPQTATFYQMVGLDVNLRGLMFKDVKVTTESVEGKPVLVIEGMITGEAVKPVELPRLRFSVHDAQGAEIYAWNAVLEQPVLKPGERVSFKSRLASPPPEGRNIDIRFFSKRDIAGGHV
jgi:hypothetical protein